MVRHGHTIDIDIYYLFIYIADPFSYCITEVLKIAFH